MSTEQAPAPAKKLTITLTDRPPVKIVEDQWPIIASGEWSDHDGQVECQANRKWNAWIKVRQHTDGRTIVYGRYSYSTAWQNEADANHRDGQIVTPTAEEYAEDAREGYWVSPRIIDAIKEVGARLEERSKSEHWQDVIAECIADLPAEELA